MDPAGLSLRLLLDINFEKKISFKDSVFIDGMGNDTYMGHLPGKRELQKMFFQKYITKFNIHNFFSINFMNKLGKWGDLFRPDYMANFPGSKIKLHNYFNHLVHRVTWVITLPHIPWNPVINHHSIEERKVKARPVALDVELHSSLSPLMIAH